MSEGQDAVLELAEGCFEMARIGVTEQLVAYVDARVPVNLTDRGQTPLAGAVFKGSGTSSGRC